MQTLDKLDKQILRSLQLDGRATYDQLAEQVSLSPSAVLRRVKRLEESGVIDRYVALVKPESVGLCLSAHLNVRLEKNSESHKRNPMDLFRASVQAWPEVVECVALTGDMDYFFTCGSARHGTLQPLCHEHTAQTPECARLQNQFRAGQCEGDNGDTCLMCRFMSSA